MSPLAITFLIVSVPVIIAIIAVWLHDHKKARNRL